MLNSSNKALKKAISMRGAIAFQASAVALSTIALLILSNQAYEITDPPPHPNIQSII
jgi:hypothetical protein